MLILLGSKTEAYSLPVELKLFFPDLSKVPPLYEKFRQGSFVQPGDCGCKAST